MGRHARTGTRGSLRDMDLPCSKHLVNVKVKGVRVRSSELGGSVFNPHQCASCCIGCGAQLAYMLTLCLLP
eukprot:jgi/Chrzof1/10857/Cz05g14210.t1